MEPVWNHNISKVSISEDSISEYNSVKDNAVEDNSCGQLGWLSCLELLLFFE